jgi:hypothetical protein
MLPKPSYIARAATNAVEIPYEWHDWRAFDYCQPVDDEFVASCAKLVDPAISALTIAEGEWLAFRYDRVSRDLVPFYHLEAAWCANVDRHYSWPIELPKNEWQGPVRRPLLLGVILVNHPLYELEEYERAVTHPALLSRLIEHVLPDSTPFLQWRSECLERLQAFYAIRQEADPFEDLFEDRAQPVLVPREVFDPDFDFSPEGAAELAERFLRAVDYVANPFLLTPEQMRIEGFDGTPYTVSR